MRTPEECIEKAEQAEHLAARTVAVQSKTVLLDVARRWRELSAKDTGLQQKMATLEELMKFADAER